MTHRHCLRSEIVWWEEQDLVPSPSSSLPHALSLLLCQGLSQGPWFILVRLPTTAQINAFCDRWCCYCCAGLPDRDANHYRISSSALRGCRIMMLLWQDLTLPWCSLSARTLARSDLRNYMEIVFVFACQYISRRWGSNSLWVVWKEALAGKSHLSIVSRALSPRPQSTQWLWNYRETGSWIQKIAKRDI